MVVRGVTEGLSRALFAGLSVMALTGASQAMAADVQLNYNMALPSSPGLISQHHVESLLELRHKNMVIQERDFSCGAASLATILRYYLGLDITEVDTINGLVEIAKQRGTLERIIERRGFSLLDLKSFAESLGFQSAGYRLEFSDLVGLKMPALVPIIPEGYKHFVVFRGADDHFVYLADPSFGNLIESIDLFKHDWYGYTNVALVIFLPDSEKDKKPPLALSDLDKIHVVSEGISDFIYRPDSGVMMPPYEPLRYNPSF